ncbi:MAG: TetR/AcrR family transcriptional regulator [Clostridia bacterium]|nr:TetR/AcrR family transcriptional regulator [Clostridia bacterium]
MIKGELRKKQILETSERLFGERGYEATGVQDILDALKLSKGSFYHHYESKEQVLQTICENRADAAAEKLKGQTFETGLAWMNALITGMIPFQGEGMTFLKIILPVFVLPEGKSVRRSYQEALKRSWLNMAQKALEQMIQEGDAYTPYPAKTAEIALDLVNNLWAEISEAIIWKEKNDRQKISPTELLNLVEPYRPALENLFSAPYGSIEIIQLEALTKMVNDIHNWWMVDQ